MKKGHVIYLWRDLSILLLNDISSSMHCHYAIEIYIALESHFKMDFGKGCNLYQGLIIDSNVPHKFSGNGTCLLILINPNHTLAKRLLKNVLSGESFKKLNPETFENTLAKLSGFHEKLPTYKQALELIETSVKIPATDLTGINSIDSRVKKVISLIRSSYMENIGLRVLASLTGLSTSRIRHLFKKETGITVRQYILNIRLIEAVKLIIDGHSKTYAAHEAGFSDSAHLSRTFRKCYGLTLSGLYKNCLNKNIRYYQE